MSDHINYYEYRDRNSVVTCPRCQWSGNANDEERYFPELLDVKCPECKNIILVVSYPTFEETVFAARSGNKEAIRELKRKVQSNVRRRMARLLELKQPDELPDLVGQDLHILWDFEESDNETWTIIRCGNKILWKELAYYEGYERYLKVFRILYSKYGQRLKTFKPTSTSNAYFHGDNGGFHVLDYVIKELSGNIDK